MSKQLITKLIFGLSLCLSPGLALSQTNIWHHVIPGTDNVEMAVTEAFAMIPDLSIGGFSSKITHHITIEPPGIQYSVGGHVSIGYFEFNMPDGQAVRYEWNEEEKKFITTHPLMAYWPTWPIDRLVIDVSVKIEPFSGPVYSDSNYSLPINRDMPFRDLPDEDGHASQVGNYAVGWETLESYGIDTSRGPDQAMVDSVLRANPKAELIMHGLPKNSPEGWSRQVKTFQDNYMSQKRAAGN